MTTISMKQKFWSAMVLLVAGVTCINLGATGLGMGLGVIGLVIGAMFVFGRK